MSRALVLGAGISGLTAAHYLRARGCDVTVLEAAEEAGGTLRTEAEDGFRCELGPNTILGSPELEELCALVDQEQDLVDAAPEAKHRYLVLHGKLMPLPTSPPALAKTPLLSLRGRMRLLTEPLRKAAPDREESVAAFLRRRFGREAAERAADAAVAGIYAGDPEELSVHAAFPRLAALEAEHGSVLKGLASEAKERKNKTGQAPKRRPVGFRSGFQALAQNLAEPLDIRYRHRAVALDRDGDEFLVRGQGPKGEVAFRAPTLITALPATPSSSLLSGLGTFKSLGSLPQAPLAVIALGYPRSSVPHPLEGFGFLVPRSEGKSLLGCLFSSSLFPHQAPEGMALLTVMAGGRLNPALCDLEESTLLARIKSDLRDLLRITAEPVFQTLKTWRPGIPQYTPLLSQIQAEVSALEKANPGLQVLGNWLHGVGVTDCVRAAKAAAFRDERGTP